MTFRLIASLTALVCAVLFAALMFVPHFYIPAYGVAADTGGTFMTRRASPMFLGLAVFLWLARDAGKGAFRDAAAISVAVTFIGVACTGILAWGQGIASPLILAAAFFELALAIALLISRNK